MKRRVFYLVLLVLSVMCFIPKNAYAKAKGDVFYTTPKGIELTEEEYNFLTTFYWDNYVNIMTEEQYEDFANSDLLEGKLITASIDDGNLISPKSSSHTTPSKNLKITATCSSYCIVSIVATWLANPTTRSYDVIGAYLSGPTVLTSYTASVSNNTNVYYYDNVQTDSGTYFEGFGNSVLLPSGSNLVICQMLTTSPGGHIFASYQHAVVDVSLATSKKYNFSLGGYGSVFLFYGSAVNKYDGMAGVDIAV